MGPYIKQKIWTLNYLKSVVKKSLTQVMNVLVVAVTAQSPVILFAVTNVAQCKRTGWITVQCVTLGVMGKSQHPAFGTYAKRSLEASGKDEP
jgi:hypothetical protein